MACCRPVVEPPNPGFKHERLGRRAGDTGFAAGELRPLVDRASSGLGLDQRRNFEFHPGSFGSHVLRAQGRPGPGSLRPFSLAGAAPRFQAGGRAAGRGSCRAHDLRSARRIPAQRRDRTPFGPRRALRTLCKAQGTARGRRLVRRGAQADVLTTLRRRMPALPVILYPASVQGAGAAAEIAAAIGAANAHAEVDALIVCRGGGSIEDLWAFNEERVAQAIFDSRIPIVSGVGHETDFTICDFVADARAPTPTAAAALVAPDCRALVSRIAALEERLRRVAQRMLEIHMQRLDGAARRLVHPAARIEAQGERLGRLALRLARAAAAAQAQRRRELALSRQHLVRLVRSPPPQRAALDRTCERWQRTGTERIDALGHRLAGLARGLKHLSPQGVLDRGYSIVTTESGAIVQDASQVAAGDEVALRFARGAADARVTRTKSG